MKKIEIEIWNSRFFSIFNRRFPKSNRIPKEMENNKTNVHYIISLLIASKSKTLVTAIIIIFRNNVYFGILIYLAKCSNNSNNSRQ